MQNNHINMEFQFGDILEAPEIVSWELGNFQLDTDPNMRDHILSEYEKSDNKEEFLVEFESKLTTLFEKDGIEASPRMQRMLDPIIKSKKRRKRRRKR